MSWNGGYDINYLKSICQIFKTNEKRFTFGQFSRIKERDIVKYLDQENILHINNSCIVWRRLQRDSFKKDFRGEKVKFKKGDIIVDRFTTNNYKEGLVLFEDFTRAIKNKYLLMFESAIYVNIFEEDLITKKIIKEKSFHYNYL